MAVGIMTPLSKFILRIMGTFGRVAAISTGVLAGGGIGFYWRETYMLKARKEKIAALEAQLNILKKNRKEKECLLHDSGQMDATQVVLI